MQTQYHVCVARQGPNFFFKKKDIKAVTTPVTAPIVKEPLNIPRKMPTDLKKAAASKVWVFSPAG